VYFPSRPAAILAVTALIGLSPHPVLATPALSQGAADAFSLVQEEQTVTGPLKRPQPLSETPSSVSVITAAEIRANGYHTLAEALRWVRGLFVTYDRNYYYLGIRGLQRPGDYNNKVLVALDGHTINGNVYGDAYFGPDLGLDMEAVERIEIVRGPGSALYGSYAALAVINVVTRRPRSEPGMTLNARAGGAGERRGFASLASARPGRPEWSARLSWLDATGDDLYFPEFGSPLTRSGRAVGLDGEHSVAFLGSAEWAQFRLAVKLNERRKTVPTGSFGTRFGDPRNQTYDGHDLVELSTTRQPSEAVEVSGRAYWDGARYWGTYVYGDSAPVLNRDYGAGDVFGTEWRSNWSHGPHTTLTLGAEAQAFVRTRLRNFDESPFYSYYDRTQHDQLGALYLQDEARFGQGLRITGGARVDGTPGYAPVLSPRLDLVWRAGPSTTWKVLAGTAFRAPTPYESGDLDGNLQLQNSGLLPERVSTLEGALERELGRVTGSLSAYVSHIRDLIDLVSVDSTGAVQYRNRGSALARGLEAEARFVGATGDRVRFAAALQDGDDSGTARELSNSPRWNAHVVLTHAPVDRPISLGFGARYLSPRRTLGGAWNAATFVADTRIARRFGRGVELGLEAKNLFDARVTDPGSGEHVQDVLLQDPRTLFFTVSFHPATQP
jgi:outer membrane receptor protein involved in Fe transport